MGKPVDISAWPVITGDPNLEFNKVGVPKNIVMNLTYPEQGGFYHIFHPGPRLWSVFISKAYNTAYLQELVQNRPTAPASQTHTSTITDHCRQLRLSSRCAPDNKDKPQSWNVGPNPPLQWQPQMHYRRCQWEKLKKKFWVSTLGANTYV